MKFAFKVILSGDSAAIGVDGGHVSDGTHNARIIQGNFFTRRKIQGIWSLKYCGYPVRTFSPQLIYSQFLTAVAMCLPQWIYSHHCGNILTTVEIFSANVLTTIEIFSP